MNWSTFFVVLWLKENKEITNLEIAFDRGVSPKYRATLLKYSFSILLGDIASTM